MSSSQYYKSFHKRHAARPLSDQAKKILYGTVAVGAILGTALHNRGNEVKQLVDLRTKYIATGVETQTGFPTTDVTLTDRKSGVVVDTINVNTDAWHISETEYQKQFSHKQTKQSTFSSRL